MDEHVMVDIIKDVTLAYANKLKEHFGDTTNLGDVEILLINIVGCLLMNSYDSTKLTKKEIDQYCYDFCINLGTALKMNQEIRVGKNAKTH